MNEAQVIEKSIKQWCESKGLIYPDDHIKQLALHIIKDSKRE